VGVFLHHSYLLIFYSVQLKLEKILHDVIPGGLARTISLLHNPCDRETLKSLDLKCRKVNRNIFGDVHRWRRAKKNHRYTDAIKKN
jgi:hypothetical protein